MKYAQGTTLEKIVEGGDSLWIYTSDSASVTVIPNNVSDDSVTTTVDRTDGTVKYGPYYKPTVIRFTATADEMDVRNYAFSVTPDGEGEFNEIMAATGGMTPDEVGGAINSAASSAGLLLSKLDQDLYDCTVFVFSDSTGNSQSEWVYKYSEWIASKYKNYTVEYYLWDDDNDTYLAPVEIQAGTGVNTLSIYNGAVAGSRPAHLMGSKYPSAVINIPDADLVICNHGHNMLDYLGTNEENIATGRVPLMLEAFAQILVRHDGAGVIVVSQNPHRDTDDYSPQYIANNQVAGMINADLADSYKLFVQSDKSEDLYIDNIHPSDAGTELYLQAIKRLHSSTNHKAAINPLRSNKNLLSNGDFVAFSGATPDDFTEVNCTTIKNTSIYESSEGYSVDMSKTSGGSQSYITQNLDRKSVV